MAWPNRRGDFAFVDYLVLVAMLLISVLILLLLPQKSPEMEEGEAGVAFEHDAYAYDLAALLRTPLALHGSEHLRDVADLAAHAAATNETVELAAHARRLLATPPLAEHKASITFKLAPSGELLLSERNFNAATHTVVALLRTNTLVGFLIGGAEHTAITTTLPSYDSTQQIEVTLWVEH